MRLPCNPAMICGPILFKAQLVNGLNKLEELRVARAHWPSKYDMYYNIFDVRDL